jgi:allantoin racemase
MRILLANPNTSRSVTDAITVAARGVAGAGTEIVPVTAEFGARVIATRTEMAIAEHAAIQMLAGQAAGCDAAIIGASIDCGLQAGREMLAIPVLSLTESAIHAACLCGGRFGVVVMSALSGIVLREMLHSYGLASRMAGLRVVAVSPLELLAGREAAAAVIASACCSMVEQDAADSIVLIGAVMAGMPALVQDSVPVPVIEGVTAAVGMAEAMVRLRLPKARSGSFARLPVRELVGVHPSIAGHFAG